MHTGSPKGMGRQSTPGPKPKLKDRFGFLAEPTTAAKVNKLIRGATKPTAIMSPR
jgi:hypothetical protein